MLFPQVTFGIIVLNGEPFTRYNLRALYPFAHQIIVAEGASPHAAHAATANGHSVDGTLEVLSRFQAEEDPAGKVIVVTAEDEGHPDGFWPGEKDEQSQAYAKRSTGDYLWQVDIDEFYRQQDIASVLQLLADDPSITAITFPEIPFWGSFDYRCEGIELQMGYSQFHRLFKWGPGYRMISHRPPTVTNAAGVDVRSLHWLSAPELEERNIHLYHYSQLFPRQVSNKMTYYEQLIANTKRAQRIKNVAVWYQDTFLSLRDPFHVHTVNTRPSWLVRFYGSYPEQILALKSAIEKDEIRIAMRDMSDVEKLLMSRRYQAGVLFWKLWTNYVEQTQGQVRRLVRGQTGANEFLSAMWRIITGKQRVFPILRKEYQRS